MRTQVSVLHGAIEIAARPADILAFASDMVEAITGEKVTTRLSVTDYGPAEGVAFSFEIDHLMQNTRYVMDYESSGNDIWADMESDQEVYNEVYRPMWTLIAALAPFFPKADVDFDSDDREGHSTFVTFIINPEGLQHEFTNDRVIRLKNSDDGKTGSWTFPR